MKPISWYKSLSEPKARRDSGCFIAEGKRAVDQLLKYHRETVAELLYVDGAEGIDASDIPVRTVSAANMKTISPSDTPQGIAAVVRIPEDVYTPNLPAAPGDRVLLLEDVQDPGNTGTLIRTAAAFGYDGVIMSGKCADPFSPKVARSTAGSLLSLWIRRSDGYMDMALELKNRGYGLIGTDLNGEDISGKININPHVLILGNEGAGLSHDMLDICDRKVRIPINPTAAESLNVAVSGGILMFMFSKN